MRRIGNFATDRQPERKVWREPVLSEYEVDKVTAADAVFFADAVIAS